MSRRATAGSDTSEAFALGEDLFEMGWYVGTPELIEQIAWRVCHVCEVYWIGRPTCWLCQRPAGSGFPRLESVAARNPAGDEVDFL